MRRTIRLLALAHLAIAAATVAPIPGAAQQTGMAVQDFNYFFTTGDYAAALAEAQKQEAAAKARVGINHPDYAAAINKIALVYEKQGRLADAEALFKRALSIFEKVKGG